MPGLSLGRKSDIGEKTIRFLTSLGFKDFIYTCFTVFYSQISLNTSFFKVKNVKKYLHVGEKI